MGDSLLGGKIIAVISDETGHATDVLLDNGYRLMISGVEKNEYNPTNPFKSGEEGCEGGH